MTTRTDTKTAAVRAALTQAARPLTLQEVQVRVERRLKQIISKQKLYLMLANLCTAGELDTVGRGDSRFYWFRKEVAL